MRFVKSFEYIHDIIRECTPKVYIGGISNKSKNIDTYILVGVMGDTGFFQAVQKPFGIHIEFHSATTGTVSIMSIPLESSYIDIIETLHEWGVINERYRQMHKVSNVVHLSQKS